MIPQGRFGFALAKGRPKLIPILAANRLETNIRRRWIWAVIAATNLLLDSGVGAGAQPKVPFKYAPPRCAQPRFNVLPQAQDSQAPDQAKASYYDYEVRQYNREVEAYSRCIKNYVAKANRDVKQIQDDAAAEAKRIMDAANSSVAVIRSQIRKAAAGARKLSGKPTGDARGSARPDGAR